MMKREPKPKLSIPTRAPKPKGGMYDNLRRPDQVESIPFEELVAPTENGIPAGIPPMTPIGIPSGIPGSIPKSIPANVPAKQEPRKQPETFTPLDATHTASEKSVYSIMYRETISKGVTDRRFGPAELRQKTGIGSRNTVHRALYGLVAKYSVEVIEEAKGNVYGPLYRVYKPNEIEQRRKVAGVVIDPQSKEIVAGIPGGIPRGIPKGMPAAIAKTEYPRGDTTIPNIGTHIKEDQIKDQIDDDEATPFKVLRSKFTVASTELTGKSPAEAEAERWGELADVLITELRIAAGRTTVSSVPAFLTEHLRRRLWKKEKRQIEAEATEQKVAAQGAKVDASRCPDCFGTGMYYPEGFEKGVARCEHSRLVEEGSE